MLVNITANVNHVACVSRIKAGVEGDLCYKLGAQLMEFPHYFLPHP